MMVLCQTGGIRILDLSFMAPINDGALPDRWDQNSGIAEITYPDLSYRNQRVGTT